MKLSILIFLLPVLFSNAQTIGNFTLTNVTDNNKISLSSYSTSPAVIIIFTSNTCPFDRHYADRIQKLADNYAGKIPVLLINSFTDDEESVEAMRTHAQQQKFTIPYLADKDQKVLTQFNARKSPEAFLLKSTAGKFTVAYRGAIDDNAQSAEDVVQSYLNDALQRMLAGQKIETVETRPVGCNIRRN